MNFYELLVYCILALCVSTPNKALKCTFYHSVIFQTILPLALMAAKCACKQKLWEYKSLRGFQNFEDVLNVNPWVTSQACQFILQHACMCYRSHRYCNIQTAINPFQLQWQVTCTDFQSKWKKKEKTKKAQRWWWTWLTSDESLLNRSET